MFVLLYGSTENPLGFPDDYPKEAIESESKDPGPPWVKMTRSEYDALIVKNREIARSIIEQSNVVKEADDSAKLDALKRLFDEAEAIDDSWASATNAQKFELAQKTFRILRRQKRAILDQYRPE